MDTHKANEIIKILKRLYPEAKCSLIFKNAYELLVATVLSAQCTDKRVNQVTPLFFKRFKSVQSLAKASLEEVEKLIQSTNFYKNKAKALILAAQKIVSHHQGHIPTTLEELIALPGVGRKTAHVILVNAFHQPALVVDTHVKRLAQRLGFTDQQDPYKIELDLIKYIPNDQWGIFSHYLIAHGRSVCSARKPKCSECNLQKICPTGILHKGVDLDCR